MNIVQIPLTVPNSTQCLTCCELKRYRYQVFAKCKVKWCIYIAHFPYNMLKGALQ